MRIKLQSLAKQFIDFIALEKNFSTHTVRAYESDLKHFFLFWEKLPEEQQAHLGPRSILERYILNLYHKKIDKSSIARKFSCFRSFERFAKKFNVDLSLKLPRPRPDKKLPVYLSVDEIFYLLDRINDEDLHSKKPVRDKAILELLYATGIRCSELVSIQYKNIDMENKTIVIKGKGKKERIVLFGQKAYDRLIAYFNHERPKFYNNDEYIFLNYKGEPLTTRSIQRIIEMFRTFLEIKKKITPHKIRHSFATHLINQGVDLRTVQELLGHCLLSTTEKYTHISLQKLNEVCDKFHPFNKRDQDS